MKETLSSKAISENIRSGTGKSTNSPFVMNTYSTSPSPIRQTLALMGWLALCFTAAAGAAFVSIDGWYATLIKPSWNPPSWLFGPVWSLLYVMMGVAAWLVWCEGGWKLRRQALGFFLVQLLLNALWTPLFFGLHQPGMAFAEIIALWLSLFATVTLFWREKKVAGFLLLPYLVWVTFAALLNFKIWRLNP